MTARPETTLVGPGGALGEPLVEAAGVGVRYNRRQVLDGVYLVLRRGDQMGLTGRSGSGKTSLMLTLAGLLRPTTGSVTWPGLPGKHPPGMYVPQAPSLVAELTAVENVVLALRLRGDEPAPSRRAAVDQLAALGLADAADALPGELSAGMQQRIALARALVPKPALLLADEPTGALDRATGRHTLAVLRAAAAASGSALLIATHDAEIAASLPRLMSLDEPLRRVS